MVMMRDSRAPAITDRALIRPDWPPELVKESAASRGAWMSRSSAECKDSLQSLQGSGLKAVIRVASGRRSARIGTDSLSEKVAKQCLATAAVPHS